eukprot:1155971-Pelagomonas_calceolata.AAC.3
MNLELRLAEEWTLQAKVTRSHSEVCTLLHHVPALMPKAWNPLPTRYELTPSLAASSMTQWPTLPPSTSGPYPMNAFLDCVQKGSKVTHNGRT